MTAEGSHSSIEDLDVFVGVWRMEASLAPDTAPQAETTFEWLGTFDETGNTISGAWEISRDGSTWEHDFDLIYTREPG
jgi:hypothetical protein